MQYATYRYFNLKFRCYSHTTVYKFKTTFTNLLSQEYGIIYYLFFCRLIRLHLLHSIEVSFNVLNSTGVNPEWCKGSKLNAN
jgi:hypothetical protein